MTSIAKLILPLSLLTAFAMAEPTGMRAWKSTAGTTIEATAEKVVNGQVSMKAADGRALVVPMDKLSEQDREFLKAHFAIKEPEPGQPTDSGAAPLTDGLPHPVGEVSGPIDAGGGSHYHVYLPKTLRQGRKTPLMLHTGAGGGNANSAKMYAEAAELAGWILASCVESKNGQSFEANHDHAKRCVEHLIANLPIDENRVYFTGGSGGGAMSFYNALRIKSAGNMPLIGYSHDGTFEKGQYCYGIGGTRDYNRYATAGAIVEFKDRGFHRLHPGGHDGGPAWIGVEGILWLNGRYLGDRKKESEFDAERLDFEASLITWARGLSEKEPYRAHYWCTFLTEEYQIAGANAAPVAKLLEKLGADPINARYTAGLAAIDGFSEKLYGDGGARVGSRRKFTTPQTQKAAEKLATEYAGVPLIEEIAKDLGSPTG
ncbi:hypothetical protein HZ994_14240 [Akkermansiaceae bacterium]|nr:hypothetical protein HZ994_14240 [Akkermansiaceae bacterium]